MKRIMTVFAVAAFLSTVGLASPAFAIEEQVVTPTFVGCLESGTCFIVVSPSIFATNTTCPNTTQVRFPANAVGGQSIYSAALSALLAGKKLTIKATNSCITGFPRPEYVHIGTP